MRCPRCRKGKMFTHANPYKKLKLSYIFEMPDSCPVCDQKFDLEPGFWYGTGYVSYALAVAVSATTFVAWWTLVGVSFNDNRVFYWLGLNTFLLVALQPWMMQMSRVIYIYFFIKYDKHYKETAAKGFDY
jgi:hypothetical protein